MRALLRCGWAVAVVAGLSMSLVGCGGGDTSNAPPPITGGGEAKPLEGKKVSDADQLLGGWVTASAAEDQFAGMEFLPEGKVLMSFDGGHAEQMSYSVLEGGRLSMKDPNSSEVLIWNVTISGSQMELTAERSTATGVEKTSKRLRRLKKDESLAAAMSELKAQRQQLAQARRDAVNALIKHGDLVIVAKGEGAELPPAVAVGPENPSGQRTAVHDDKPPHRDGFTIYPGSATQQGAMTINVAYLPQVEPPPVGQAQHGGNFVFEFTGDPASPKVIAKVNYGGKPLELELRRDAKLHGEITGRFTAELARIESLKKPLIDALKDVAVLEGPSAGGGPGAPDSTARFTLVRDAEKGVYTGEGTLTQPAAGGVVRVTPFAPPTASILVNDGKPMLLIDTKLLQYQLTLDASGEKLTGGWFYPNNPNGFVAELEIKSAVDAATHKAKVDAERKALSSLSPASPFVGVRSLPAAFLPQPVPVALTLTSGADGSVTGTLVAPIVGGTYEVQGAITDTISGPRLTLRIGNMTEAKSQHASNLHGSLRNQPWVLAVAGAEEGKPLVLTDGASEFTQATDAHKAAIRKSLTDALTAGLKMQVVHPNYGPNQPRQTFELKVDAAGKVTGSTIAAGRGDFDPASTIEGEITESAGMPMLTVQILHPPPAKANAFRRIYAAEIVATPAADGWYMAGPYVPLTNAQARQYVGMKQVTD